MKFGGRCLVQRLRAACRVVDLKLKISIFFPFELKALFKPSNVMALPQVGICKLFNGFWIKHYLQASLGTV
eukprot:2733966-Amphidinium_carterae.1